MKNVKNKKIQILLLLTLITLTGCNRSMRTNTTKMTTDKKDLGVVDGKQVYLYTLRNVNGLKATVMNYGATVVSLDVPDRNGKMADIVLGFDSLDEYIKYNDFYSGNIVGRYGNRIANGKFTLDGVEYTLATNDGKNHLHGGIKGYDKVVWDSEAVYKNDAVGVKLSYLSKDAEEGYPGNLNITVFYYLTNNNELSIEYYATTDKATPVNLTHHGYFNLAGQDSGDILSHELMINADRFTVVDAGLIPTGELKAVKETPMDFTKPTPIGARINSDYQQLVFGKGYDHNWVLNKTDSALTLAASLYEPKSRRLMKVYTTEPAIQFYSGNFLNGSHKGKQGMVYKHRSALCLETQHYPDSPNHPEFPSVVLSPGNKYYHKTVYRFLTK